MTAAARRDALAETIARTVSDVPGVAFLRPSLVHLLASSARAALPRAPSRAPAGVRVTRAGGRGPWEVEVQVVIRDGHRALDVARAVREAVTAVLPDTEPVARVTVTVTNTV